MKSITHKRNCDFIRQCLKSAETLKLRGAQPTVTQIVRHALVQPAPAYYTDFTRAADMVLNRRNQTDDSQRRYAPSLQWNDMARDFRRIKAKFPRRTDTEIISDLCSGNAGTPRFYLSPRHALEIAYPVLSQTYPL